MTAALRHPDRDVWTVDDLAGDYRYELINPASRNYRDRAAASQPRPTRTFETDLPRPVRLDLPALAARYERLLAPSRSVTPTH